MRRFPSSLIHDSMVHPLSTLSNKHFYFPSQISRRHGHGNRNSPISSTTNLDYALLFLSVISIVASGHALEVNSSLVCHVQLHLHACRLRLRCDEMPYVTHLGQINHIIFLGSSCAKAAVKVKFLSCGCTGSASTGTASESDAGVSNCAVSVGAGLQFHQASGRSGCSRAVTVIESEMSKPLNTVLLIGAVAFHESDRLVLGIVSFSLPKSGLLPTQKRLFHPSILK
ncbi:hypothetical protein ACP4OV_015874 [Aristida adscensionis]